MNDKNKILPDDAFEILRNSSLSTKLKLALTQEVKKQAADLAPDEVEQLVGVVVREVQECVELGTLSTDIHSVRETIGGIVGVAIHSMEGAGAAGLDYTNLSDAEQYDNQLAHESDYQKAISEHRLEAEETPWGDDDDDQQKI